VWRVQTVRGNAPTRGRGHILLPDTYAESTMIVAILLANAVFNLVTWPTFFRRVARDARARDEAGKPTAFFTVHLVLLILGLALAAFSLAAAAATLIGVW